MSVGVNELNAWLKKEVVFFKKLEATTQKDSKLSIILGAKIDAYNVLLGGLE